MIPIYGFRKSPHKGKGWQVVQHKTTASGVNYVEILSEQPTKGDCQRWLNAHKAKLAANETLLRSNAKPASK